MILYFDTETTGLNPGQICQISYIMQYENKTVAKNKYFTVDSMDLGALSVHGLSMDKLKVLSNGARFRDEIEEIASDFESSDMVVSHNTAFDFAFMRTEFLRENKIFSCKNEFCSMKNMTPVCKLPRKTGVGYKYPKLSELCEYFKLSETEIMLSARKLFGFVTGAHDARFDTTAVYLAVNTGLVSEPIMKDLKNYLK